MDVMPCNELISEVYSTETLTRMQQLLKMKKRFIPLSSIHLLVPVVVLGFALSNDVFSCSKSNYGPR